MSKLTIEAKMDKVFVQLGDGKVHEVKDYHSQRTFRLDKNWQVFVTPCPVRITDDPVRLGESLTYG